MKLGDIYLTRQAYFLGGIAGLRITFMASKRKVVWGAVWKKTIRFVNHVFLAYLDHSLSDMYIGNVLLIYRTKYTLSRTKIHAQNKSDKIVFFQTARHTPFGKKNNFVTPVFRAYLDYN